MCEAMLGLLCRGLGPVFGVLLGSRQTHPQLVFRSSWTRMAWNRHRGRARSSPCWRLHGIRGMQQGTVFHLRNDRFKKSFQSLSPSCRDKKGTKAACYSPRVVLWALVMRPLTLVGSVLWVPILYMVYTCKAGYIVGMCWGPD